MNIPNITKTKTLGLQSTQETASQNAPKEIKGEETGKSAKARVDSAEISAGRADLFGDKRLSAFKSALLYDLSSETVSRRAEELKKQVESGEYHVPTDILAEALYE
ncbi:MAG: flagellar biosynthesis anti-sigma factor FlgM [Clostridiales Family XIII bacterium]|jgi:anti-sigma28 factor (negative regulator of flagellin synthesis)|nr:flagellar biosynthesis anti-sigma factor FlgM [Clostridiales Family XIII bacterium]